MEDERGEAGVAFRKVPSNSAIVVPTNTDVPVLLLSSSFFHLARYAWPTSPQRLLQMTQTLPTLDRITIDPAQMNGQPCIRGMRLTVRRVLSAIAAYPNREELRREYPELEEEDLRQALACAAAVLENEIRYEMPYGLVEVMTWTGRSCSAAAWQ